MTNAADIEEQAAIWLARCDAGLEANEEGQFSAWLEADPRHRAAYLRLRLAWERSADLKRLVTVGAPINPDLLAPGNCDFRSGNRKEEARGLEDPEDNSRPESLWQRRREDARQPRWRLWALAASIVAASTIAAYWVVGPSGPTTYSTGVGGLSRVVLSDGSAVTLNTDTELRVHLTKAKREVELVRGEAQFQVAHDTARPFDVAAAGRIVRAVGTAFDVELKDHSVTILVTEGRVAVGEAGETLGIAPDSLLSGTSGTAAVESSSHAITLVSAGQSAVAQGREVTVRATASGEASRHLAWESGELSFQGETLKEAVEEFNRYNVKKLRVEDPSIQNLTIGGNFQALDEESFVAALQESFGVRAKATAEGVELRGDERRGP